MQENTGETQELISVLIPLYNHKNTIGRCIESIQAQTYPNVEIIVVDDGSADDGYKIAESYDGVTVLRQENSGAPVARNKAFDNSKGEFVIFCDADVLMEPDMLETMHRALKEHPEHAFAYGAFYLASKLFRGVPFDKQTLFERNYISTMSLIRREDFPRFDEKLKRFQDWDLWLTIVKQGKTGILCSEEKALFKALVDGKSRIGTHWMPAFLYKVPFISILWAPKQMKKYKAARKVIAEKHEEVSE